MAVLRSATLLLLLLSLAACAAGKRDFVAAEPTLEQGSVLYIYRPFATANMLLVPALSVAGADTMHVRNGEYRMLALVPGEYTFRLEAVTGYTAATQLKLEVKAGKVYYLRLDSTLSMGTEGSYSAYQRGFSLSMVAAEQAREEIVKCSDALASENSRTAKGRNEVDSAQPEARFSTDKTANPFSH